MRYRKLHLTSVFTTLILITAQSSTTLPRLFQTSQVLAQAPQNPQAAAANLYQQGEKQIQTSQYREALQSFQRALAIYREIKNRRGEALTLNYIAIVNRTLGDNIQALNFYKQALSIFREIGDSLNEGTVLNNIGIIHENLGQYPQALEFYQQALTIRKKVGDRNGEAFTLTNLGFINTTLGQYPQALKFYQQSLAIFKSLGDKRREALTLNAIGIYYRTINEYPQALGFYQQALNIFIEIGERRGEATTLNNIGDFRRNQGEYLQAQELFQKALNLFIQVGDKSGEGVALSNLGRVYLHQKQYPQTQQFFRQALAIFQQLGDKASEARTLRYIGSVFYESGEFTSAEQTLREGVEILESLRTKLSDANKISIFETQIATYQLLQKVLIAQNKISEALEISERGRSRAFVELLSSRQNLAITLDKPTISSLKQIAKTQNATLVQYSIISNENLYIWVIQPTGEIAFEQVDLQKNINIPLKNLVTMSRKSIGISQRRGIQVQPSRNNQPQQLQKLHEILIKPIEKHLPKDVNSRVIFIPQESLFLVPFAALQDDNGKYLIENHTILTAPSIQVLDLTSKQRISRRESVKKKGDILVVGNPTMPKMPITNEQLTSLRGAEKEAIEIADLLKTQAIIGSKATKSAILPRMKQARIIHFATHGLLDDFKGFGVPGAIALAPSSQDDGFLTAGEILDMKLNAELVVLSACDTGGGTITGDGVIGLSRSLITAGVPSVIVSLWSVNDNSTAFFMSEFYRHLQKNPDKAVALRQAMLTTKQKYNHPFDWAAFTLIGESN
ncbi:hypothetical protein CLI64_07900 [Nostoc sp. CENA543]|uniref:CHAT domain-containing protein n=1 Tax=Nostoc sp. CENA543 TaxID=1869241 RepID=UPI000CA12302|nr:CHAT domain-containing tetratricopeptide repeat protein [Nostoc sp. CENA543]AUT00313.1 hypothetical protein CLI64_07900 [Nostoc sp. CENA543]